jgi:hypothetical protein
VFCEQFLLGILWDGMSLTVTQTRSKKWHQANKEVTHCPPRHDELSVGHASAVNLLLGFLEPNLCQSEEVVFALL